MTDDNKIFDKKNQKKALEKLNEKWKSTNRKCHICDSNSWIIAEDLVMPMHYSGGPLMLGGPTYPQLQVICNNCGYTHFFNAVVLDIVPSDHSGAQDG